MGKRLQHKKSDTLKPSLELTPNAPLWQRVPTKDESGKYLGDFMMIIPGLKKKSPAHRKTIINKISLVLARYPDAIVFADLNMKMSLLWISVKPLKGIMAEIPSAIIELIPEAKLISDRPPSV